jgi:hypothetical protein
MRIVHLLAQMPAPGRDLTWLGAQRARLYAGAALIAAIAILAGKVLLHGGYDADGVPYGSDFGAMWAAARLVRAGFVTGPYIADMEYLAQLVNYPAHAAPLHYPLFNPPAALLLFYPVALLSYFWALGAYVGTTGFAYAMAAAYAGRWRWMALAALGFPAVLINVLFGQIGMVTATIIGVGLMLLERRPWLAGAVLGLILVKPQMALAVPVALVLSGRWRALGGAIVSALVVLLLTTWFLGWDIWPAYLAATKSARAWLEDGSADTRNRFQSLFAWLRTLGVPVLWAYVAQLACAVGGLGAVYWTIRHRASPASEQSAIVLACLLATPYLWPYDVVVLIFPLIWLATEWSEHGFPPWGKLVLIVAYVLPISPMLTFVPPHLCLFGMIGLLAYIVWVEARSRVRPGAPALS